MFSLASFQENCYTLCKTAHNEIHKVDEELPHLLCWNITNALWYYLADVAEPTHVYTGIGYRPDTNDFLRTHLRESKLIIGSYEPNGTYTHWFGILTIDDECYLLDNTGEKGGLKIQKFTENDILSKLEDVLNGWKVDWFYKVTLVYPETRFEVYDITHPVSK